MKNPIGTVSYQELADEGLVFGREYAQGSVVVDLGLYYGVVRARYIGSANPFFGWALTP